MVDDTRNKIIAVASKLFGRYGFYKTSMDEIAKIARKAKGSLYYHFTDKKELFRVVVSTEMENFKEKMSEVVNDNSLTPTQKIKKYLLLRMEILNEAVNYHETLKADFFEHFDFIDDLRTNLDNWEKQQIGKMFEEGIKTGEFEPAGDLNILMDVFMMVLKGLEIPFFIQGNYTKYSPYFDDMLNILIKGISKN
jgi:AcrR family transcriptional regulator